MLFVLAFETSVSQVDSLANASNCPSIPLPPMVAEMLLPFILLVAFSVIKALVAVGSDEVDSYDFFAEMAIDLLSIFSSFIIGRYILLSKPQSVIITAVVIIAFMALCALALCYIRRKVLRLRNISETKVCKLTFLIISEYGIDALCLFLIGCFL